MGMATFKEANDRIIKDIWICMHCGAKQRNPKGKPKKCRVCNRTEFRIKHKLKRSK